MMKKNTLWIFASLIAVSLALFGFVQVHTPEASHTGCKKVAVDFPPEFIRFAKSQPATDLLYKIGARFVHTLSKNEVHRAESIRDLLPEKATKSIAQFDEVVVHILKADGEVAEIGMGEKFNTDQLALLQTTDYATDFYITANYKEKDYFTGGFDNNHLVYYISVKPENEARYEDGTQSLLDYLRNNSLSETKEIMEDRLKPCRINFSVNEAGKMEGIHLDATSGYPKVDALLISLLREAPGRWKPATDEQGKTVAQHFVFFFGLEGC